MSALHRWLHSAPKSVRGVKRAAAKLRLETLESRDVPSLIVGPIVNPANGHSYYLLPPSNWSDAETSAAGLGGHLVTINDAAENAWVFNTFKDQSQFGLWIGLNDVDSEGDFVWASGESTDYRNWLLDQPDDAGNEDWAHIWIQGAPNFLSTPGEWNDFQNESEAVYPVATWYLQGVVEVAKVDITPTSLVWSTALGGVDFGYKVTGADLTQDTTAALYWASGPTFADAIGDPVYDVQIEYPQGTYGPFHVHNSALGTPPANATHLLLVVDPISPARPNGAIQESDEGNNALPLRRPSLLFREMEHYSVWGVPAPEIPGLDHVAFQFNEFVYEAQAKVEAGDYFDPLRNSFVSVPQDASGVVQVHTVGSFRQNSQNPAVSDVQEIREVFLPSELSFGIYNAIYGVLGAPYPSLLSSLSGLLFGNGSPLESKNQKGGNGYFTCVGLTEWASEQAGLRSGQGIIPDAWESILLDTASWVIPPVFGWPIGTPIRLTTLTPGLQHYVATHPNEILDDTGILHAVFDPIDFILTDPLGRRLGYTEALGRINEIPNSFYTGDGVLEQLAIIDPLPGVYRLDLFGVGDQAFAALSNHSESTTFADFLGQGEGRALLLGVGNVPPVLAPISDQLAAESTLISFTAAASDLNTGDNHLFSLINAPTGASIDPFTGLFTWTAPAGPTTVQVTVRVTDNGSPALSDTQTFTITVNPAPVVSPPSPTPPNSTTNSQLIVFGSQSGKPTRIQAVNATTQAAVQDITPFAGYAGNVRVAMGDVNGDSTPDFIAVTSGAVGHVKVFDGVTGAALHSFLPFGANPMGLSVAAGDVDGDGVADIVVAPESGLTHVMAFSGRTGTVLHSFFAFPGFLSGVRLATGDVNGDGFADIIAVAGAGGNGHVKIFDAITGGVAASYFTYLNYQGEIGVAVGDLDGDGRAEVITTAKNSSRGTHVKAFSGSAGETVRNYFAPPTPASVPNSRPTVTTDSPVGIAAGDVTGDGIADILLTHTPHKSPSELIVLNGATEGTVENRFTFDPLSDFSVYVDAN